MYITSQAEKELFTYYTTSRCYFQYKSKKKALYQAEMLK